MLKFSKQSVWNGKNFIIDDNTVNAFNDWYAKQSEIDNRYKHDEEILAKFIPKSIKVDSEFNDIYFVVTLINAFYSTRMGNDYCYALSKLLHQNHQEIFNSIKLGKIETLQNIIDKQENSLKRVEFSFTTKYFSLLCRYVKKCDEFPIYDSVVAKILDFYFYSNNKNTKKLVSNMRKDYVTYYQCITDLIGKSDIKYKKLDTYLWWLGRNIISKYQEKSYNPKVFSASSDYKVIDNILTDIFKKYNPTQQKAQKQD